MKKILILESNESFASELSAYFAESGDFEICGISGDGEEGVKLIEKLSPDVTIVSLFLKTIDGFSVMEQSNLHGRKTLFVALGNQVSFELLNRVVKAGARYYFMKSVRLDALRDRVGAMIDSECARLSDA